MVLKSKKRKNTTSADNMLFLSLAPAICVLTSASFLHEII